MMPYCAAHAPATVMIQTLGGSWMTMCTMCTLHQLGNPRWPHVRALEMIDADLF